MGPINFAVPGDSTFHKKNKRKYCNVHCTCAGNVRYDYTQVPSCKVYKICSAFGSTDLSVGTDNYLKREEYSDYKQVLATFMILLTVDDSVLESSYTERRQLPLPCGVLRHAKTDNNTLDVTLFT
jgi:hypothetical protein